MEQRVISVDSQWVNNIQSCMYKTNLVFLQNMQPTQKAAPLERGSLMHDMLEVYYGLRGPRTFDTKIWQDLRESGIDVDGIMRAPVPSSTNTDALYVAFCKQVGYWSAAQKDLAGDVVDETIYQFSEYTQFYKNDPWIALAVEEVGSKVMYEDESLKIIYNFKIDLVAQNGSMVAPFDHKTGARRSEPTSLSNQFIGYCFGLGLTNIVINKIGFQKTLKPSERFQRFPLAISVARITEWVDNTVWWIKMWDRCNSEGFYPKDFTSCDKYSGCMFRKICESDPEARAWKLERDFFKGQIWDVAAMLEDSGGE